MQFIKKIKNKIINTIKGVIIPKIVRVKDVFISKITKI
jgi:hypothetical protein